MRINITQLLAIFAIGIAASAAPAGADDLNPRAAYAAAGGLAAADPVSGITDAVFLFGPPDYAYVVQKTPGAFLDCGDGARASAHDADGQSALDLTCGVTVTETVSVPQFGAKARVIVYY